MSLKYLCKYLQAKGILNFDLFSLWSWNQGSPYFTQTRFKMMVPFDWGGGVKESKVEHTGACINKRHTGRYGHLSMYIFFYL